MEIATHSPSPLSHIIVSVSASALSPTTTGDEASAEGESDISALVFAPGAKWHHDDCAVVLGTVLYRLSGQRNTRAELTH